MTTPTDKRFSNRLPLQPKRTIFKAIEPYLQDQTYLFKTKKTHQRHKSQPQFQQSKQQNQLLQPPTQSIQQHLRTIKYGYHRRVASQLSQTKSSHNKFNTNLSKVTKPTGRNLPLNKWYIRPQHRLKKPLLNVTHQSNFFTNYYESHFRQTIMTETAPYEKDTRSNGFSGSSTNGFHSESTTETFFGNEKENPNVTFVKEFVENDKKHVGLLKQFKRKKVNNMERTPQIVDLIIEMSRDGRKVETSTNNYLTTTGNNNNWSQSTTHSQSKAPSTHNQLHTTPTAKPTSKFWIQCLNQAKFAAQKKAMILFKSQQNKSRKRLTLLETQYDTIKKDLDRRLTSNETYDGFRIQKVKLR